ncbi:TIGR03013 family PEP-CTERM/XrtA system glycosyltransferase [Vibrio sp.]|nr:TIGR03013 family PEP-CTERM/XrtA system glycosyltransferase [Vibrio sp.]
MSSSHFTKVKPSSVITIISDVVIILVSFLICKNLIESYAASIGYNYTWNNLFIHVSIFLIIPVLTTLSVGLYNEKLRETLHGITLRIFVSMLLTYCITRIVYSITIIDALPIYFPECFAFITFLGLALERFIISKTPYQQVGLRRVLVLGAGTRAHIIEQNMRRKTDRIGINFVGFVPMKGDDEEGIQNETKISLDVPLEEFVLENHIDELVIACDERRNVLPNESLFICKRYGVKVVDIIDFFESETGQVAVNQVYPSWIIYGSNSYYSPLHKTLDYVFNAVIALVLFCLTWPLMLATVIAIKLEEGLKAPVIYSQTRTGLDGKAFDIFKFRSMRTDAEKDGVKWAQKSDPRVTKVGNFIRKYRIDELPQLFNVLNGDMGFVGPRPERPQFTEEFEVDIPYYNHRFNVKPGLTGWAQLKYPYGSSKQDAVEKLKYDLYYIKHRGFILDLLILLRTAEIILFGKGR